MAKIMVEFQEISEKGYQQGCDHKRWQENIIDVYLEKMSMYGRDYGLYSRNVRERYQQGCDVGGCSPFKLMTTVTLWSK